MLAGIGMAYAEVSRPASGLEHYFSHMWEMMALERGKEADLHGIIAVALSVLGLHHSAGARFNHGDRYQAAVFSEDLRHADLFAHDRFLHVNRSSCLTVSFRFRHQQEDRASSWRPPSWDSDC